MSNPYDHFSPIAGHNPEEPLKIEVDPADTIPMEPEIDWEGIENEINLVEEARRTHPQYNPRTGRIEIQSISHMHEAIMNWMLINPHLPMRYCAKEFGVTQSWLSVLKNSGLFKARMAQKQALIDEKVSLAAAGLEEKMAAVAEMGVDRLGEMVEQSKDPKFILDTTDKLLGKLGFGAKAQVNGSPVSGTGNVQNNFYVTSSEELAKARDKIRNMGKAEEVTDVQPRLEEKKE